MFRKNLLIIFALGFLLPYIPTYAQTMPYKPKNGDLVLFEDLDLPHQWGYYMLEGNTISHVGIVVIGADGEAYIMHALGKHAGLIRSINQNKKEGVVFDKLMPYLKESIESTTDKNKVYLRVKLTPFNEQDNKNFLEWTGRMAGRPYDSESADKLLIDRVNKLRIIPFANVPRYKEKPSIVEPTSTFCSGLVTAFCISGHLISRPANRPPDFRKKMTDDKYKNMTNAEYGALLNHDGYTPPDFANDKGLINLSKTYERPIRFIFPKESLPDARSRVAPRNPAR